MLWENGQESGEVFEERVTYSENGCLIQERETYEILWGDAYPLSTHPLVWVLYKYPNIKLLHCHMTLSYLFIGGLLSLHFLGVGYGILIFFIMIMMAYKRMVSPSLLDFPP